MFGFFNVKGVLLDKKQLEEFIENFASDNILKNTSCAETYPIPKMMENFEYITKVYNLLNEHIKLRIDIHPAGEWLLDNYYVIEENIKIIQKELTPKKYKNLISLANGQYKGYARIYVLASEILAYTENNITSENLKIALKAYQKARSLSMNEIWSIDLFLKIALIEKIKNICEKIYSSQLQKYRAEEIIERLVDSKNKDEQLYKKDITNQTSKIGYGELKYPFIEHLSFKLKKYGKKGKTYLDILEYQVNKMGSTINEVLKKEHYDIAIRKVSIGNCITTMKRLNRMNFQDIFQEINGVEEILKNDPAKIYDNMDYLTKENYRNKIQEISKKYKLSEIYIAQNVLKLAKQNYENPKEGGDGTPPLQNNKNNLCVGAGFQPCPQNTHVGYYLIGDGYKELLKILNIKNKKISNENKVKIYVYGITSISIIISILSNIFIFKKTNFLIALISTILISIPVSEIIIQFTQYVLGKIVKPKKLPQMDFYKGIPEEYSTFVVIPTIIKTEEKLKELMHKLEVFYLANKSENLYFALLADCSSSNKEKEEYDECIITLGEKLANNLNKKYKTEKFEKFHFLYRKRVWNDKEKAFLGWERKRGLLNQFNKFILNNDKADFISNTIDINKCPYIKYVITLDADTDLTLNSGFELVGTMAHILNKPEIKDGRVEKGYGIIQPKVGITLQAGRKSLFTQIFAGASGTDLYTNANFDVYQDNFNEGIFTGKGIYDLEVFDTVLKEQIPENTVLSHDLLEGNYLRCGLASNILLMDGYPYKYLSFMSRLHRWIRGDWQITSWLKKYIVNSKGKKIKNPLSFLSKYKILDNLRRSVFEITVILSLIFEVFTKYTLGVSNIQIKIIALVSVLAPMLIEFVNLIITKKQGKYCKKTFTYQITGIKSIVYRMFLCIAFLPHKAYISLNAIVKTIYRKYISKKHLLEWTTSEEAERLAKTDIFNYYKEMFINIVFVITLLFLSIYSKKEFERIIYFIFIMIWGIAPFVACYISKENKNKSKIKEVKKEDLDYIQNIGKKTWKYFKDTIIEENNYLPPDNYQEDRKIKFIDRTSSTNIGLGLLAIVSAYDLGYEDYENTIDLLEKSINIVNSLQKWNGHLYNWYNIKTLEPLVPRYISTVDSGNLVGYLYIVKKFLEDNMNNEQKDRIEFLQQIVNNIINNTDFTKLYDYKTNLFSIGYNVEENVLTNSYYDLLASEARQASLVAISKGDVPSKHWKNLSRTLTDLKGYKGLISWSGTAFEYLMPLINIPQYEGSLLDESCKFMIMSQIEYSKKLGIPWGMSESAFYLKDLQSNYQYKAFGIPWLGLKRGLEDEVVIASYGSMLWIAKEPNKVIENIKRLEKQGVIGKYGLYESIDYTRSRLKVQKESEVVKTFMAHHQGLILLSINNLINNDILEKRFSTNPEIEAIDILLQEKMPESVIITKQKKEKPKKIKYFDYENYTNTVYNKPEYEIDKYNVISNEDYSIIINQKGEGYSKYKDILINRYKETADTNQGMFFYIKNIKTKKIWPSNYIKYLNKPDRYTADFSNNITNISRVDGDIETITKITAGIDSPVEIRCLSLKNNGNQEEILEITSFFEPIISNQKQDIAHPVFNNLFLRYEINNDNILIERRQRDKNVEKVFLGTTFYTEDECIGELEYEINKEKFYGRGNICIPTMIQDSKPFSKTIGLVTEPIIAMKKTIKIKPGQKVKLNLIISIANSQEDCLTNLEKYKNQEIINSNFELEKIKAAEESRFLGMKSKDIECYNKLISNLIVQNKTKKLYMNNLKNGKYEQSSLWKFGISGDSPIILVKINDINEVYVIDEVLKAYEYLRFKNIFTEVVILNNEIHSYNLYTKEEIENSILNKQLAYLKNIKNGIFEINSSEISKEDIELLEFKANIIIDGHYGKLKNQLDYMEEDYKNSIKKIGDEEPKRIVLEDETIRTNMFENTEVLNEFKYYNKYGAFSKDGKEYFIKVNKDENLPTTWSHILANENFGTLVTEGMGGYTWSNNARLNRLTSWNNNPCQDIPSEIIYLKDLETGKYWSLGSRPAPDNNDYYITYGFGYAKYEHTSLGITQKLQVFVPKEDNVKVNILEIKNNLPTTKKLKLIYYIKPVLDEDETRSNGYINVYKSTNIVFFENLYQTEFKNKKAFVGVSENVKSFTGNKDGFIGSGNIVKPEAIDKTSLDNESGLGNNSCVAIELNIELKAFEEKKISLLLGEYESEIKIKDIVYKYSNINNCYEELEKVKKFWQDILQKIQIQTPVESMNILLNGWSIYQTISSRLYAKTGYYQSGGAYGFRDQLQDTLSLKYIKPEMMKNQILKHSKKQFIEGDVLHWWHEDTKRGIRTRFSDDLLWLVFVCLEYINVTGNNEILEIEEPYLKGKLLNEEENEKYDKYEEQDIKEKIYEHCKKAINNKLDFGKNGLPKIGTGDWNDGFSEVGSKGVGESVWLGFFIYYILDNFLPIMEERNDEDAQNFRNVKENLKKSLNKNAWDGMWYKRAFMDDGNCLGSIENEECRIDNIAQSWSVISKAGDNDKKYISMESMETHLVDRENMIIKLLDPPFDKGKLEPGYIKAYLPGVRENGGQYTHGAVWAIIAEAMLGFGDKAGEFFRILNPIEHARTKEMAQKYKVEPYVISADIYGSGNLIGQGGWTWYTGASSWLYKAGIEYILGLKIKNNVLSIVPSIPKDWKEYSVRYKYKNSIYNIKVKNPNGKNTGVEEFIFNGNKIEEKSIKLQDDNSVNEIEIIM